MRIAKLALMAAVTPQWSGKAGVLRMEALARGV